MKKSICIILTIAVLLLSSCVKNDSVTVTSQGEITTRTLQVNDTTVEAIESDEPIGGGEVTTQKYRRRYYSVTRPFVDLVGREEYWAWEKKNHDALYNDPKQPMIVALIKEFNISREEFDKANLELARIIRDEVGETPLLEPHDYPSQEVYEVFNSDIIFTFDDELINEYYLCHSNYQYVAENYVDEAVAEGKYEVRTKKFVFIEDGKLVVRDSEATDSEGNGIGNIVVTDKYRDRFYEVPEQFMKLADPAEFAAWKAEFEKTPKSERSEAAIVSFVKRFNISREDFDKANAELASYINEKTDGTAVLNPRNYEAQEQYEIYDSELIYSFDNAKINRYFINYQNYAYPDKKACIEDVKMGIDDYLREEKYARVVNGKLEVYDGKGDFAKG